MVEDDHNFRLATILMKYVSICKTHDNLPHYRAENIAAAKSLGLED